MLSDWCPSGVASISELVVMVNLESMNATLIKQGLGRRKRYEILSEIAQSQLQSLNNADIENRFRAIDSGDPKLLKLFFHFPTSTAKQRHSLTEMFQYSFSKRRSRIRILLIIRSLRTDISAPARGTKPTL